MKSRSAHEDTESTSEHTMTMTFGGNEKGALLQLKLSFSFQASCIWIKKTTMFQDNPTIKDLQL